jgi:hypothetical protein
VGRPNAGVHTQRKVQKAVQCTAQGKGFLFFLQIHITGDRMQVPVEPIFALIMGILILLVPRLLNYFVAVYLIIIGLLGLLHRVPL